MDFIRFLRGVNENQFSAHGFSKVRVFMFWLRIGAENPSFVDTVASLSNESWSGSWNMEMSQGV